MDGIKIKSVWKVDTGGAGSTIADTSGVLVCIPLSDTWVWQIKYSATLAGTAQRFFTYGTTWSDWEKIQTTTV